MTKGISKRVLIAWTILVFCCVGSVAWAQVVVDEWSVDIKGNVLGTGYMTFWNDFTLTGHMIIRPNLGADPLPAAFTVGFFEIEGEWRADKGNRRVGFFTGISGGACGANTTDLKVPSFSGTVTGKGHARLHMTAKTDNGPMQLAGTPPGEPGDLDGTSWIAAVSKTKENVTGHFTEFFTLTSSLDFPNLYELEGVGGGGDGLVRGCLLLSAKNKMAVQIEDSDGVRNATGKFNPRRARASLNGSDDDGAGVSITMTVQGEPE
jgi:hypothetical protein